MEDLHFRKEDRDKIAAVLSIVPGLGHLYKRHYVDAMAIFWVGIPLTAFISAWLAFATFGLSLLVVPALFILGTAFSAYRIEDKSGTHDFLHPWRH